MNEATKQFSVKYHLGQVNTSDYVNWAIDGLEDGLDSKSLRLLTGMNKNHSIKTDFEDLFHQALNELNWEYIYMRDILFSYAKDITNKILSGEIALKRELKAFVKFMKNLVILPNLKSGIYCMTDIHIDGMTDHFGFHLFRNIIMKDGLKLSILKL